MVAVNGWCELNPAVFVTIIAIASIAATRVTPRKNNARGSSRIRKAIIVSALVGVKTAIAPSANLRLTLNAGAGYAKQFGPQPRPPASDRLIPWWPTLVSAVPTKTTQYPCGGLWSVLWIRPLFDVQGTFEESVLLASEKSQVDSPPTRFVPWVGAGMK